MPVAGSDIWHYVSPGGEEYAIIGFRTGTGFVRVTDPVNPVIIGFIDGFVDERWRDMATFGEYAFVVSDGSGVGMQVINLADIDNGNISPVGAMTQFGFVTAHNLFVNPETGHAYAVGANLASGGIVVIDVNVPDSPQIVASWDEYFVHDVFVKSYQQGPHAGREIAFAFAGGEGLVVVDVTDKTNLFTISAFQYPNLTYCHQGWLSEDGRLLFINDELDELQDPDVTTSTTYVVSVEDLANPALVSTFTNGKCATDHNLMVRGNFLFEANNSTGLRVFDICNVNDVREIGFFDTHPEHNFVGRLSGAWGVDTQLPSGIVLVSDRQRGLFVLDVSYAVTSIDPDGDGVSDFCDPCPNDNPDDTDGDGVCDSTDICPNGDDAVDSDSDGVPDDCDRCPGGDDSFDADADSVPDECDRCPGGDDTTDTDGDGLPDECDICDNRFPGSCTFTSPIQAPSPHDILKNRYLSIDHRGEDGVNVGVGYDIQIELSGTLVNGVTAVGSHWWANVPDTNCISIVGPTQPTVPPNWDACPTLHLTGCPIIPTSSYDIVLVVGGLASGPSLAAHTQALPADNKWWGDAVGFFTGPEGVPPNVWTPPQGVAGFDDVNAALKTFLDPNAINATHTSVTDLHPNRPTLQPPANQINKLVNIDDVFKFIQAFQGFQYPGPEIHLCTDP